VLVLAHKPAPLAHLLPLLSPPLDVFVHMDAKSPFDPAGFALPPNARWVEPRRAVFWGGFSMVQATRDLLAAALSAGPDYARFVLISGDALPLHPSPQLAARLLAGEAEWINLHQVEDDPQTRGEPQTATKARLGWEHPGRFHNFSAWDHVLTNPFTAAETMAAYGVPADAAGRLRGEAMQLAGSILAHLPPRPRLFETFYFGSQWWALSRAMIRDLHDDIFSTAMEDYFRFMEVPDEHFFHCLVGRRMQAPDGAAFTRTHGPMWVDPQVPPTREARLTAAALRQAAQHTGCLFARKYDPAAAPDIAAAIGAGRYFEDVPGFAPA